MDTVVLFKSNMFGQSWPDTDSDSNEPPLGKDLAEWLRQGLSALGVDAKVVVEATNGWEFEVAFDRQNYIFFVHWAPIGDPPEDYWVIQTRKKKGLMKSAFGKVQELSADAQAVLDLLRCSIETSSELTDVRWVDAKEFSKIY